jgi:hypothetical protein
MDRGGATDARAAGTPCRWCGQTPCDGGLPGDPCPPDTLGARGQIYVTINAAKGYLDGLRAIGSADHLLQDPSTMIRLETARRELTRRMMTAICTREAVGRELAQYRSRSRTTQLDIAATVIEEDGLFVVTRANVRAYT